MKLAVFITAHGYGHAAREAAILAELADRDPSVLIDLYTQVPAWFFSDSGVLFRTHTLIQNDVGLIQTTPTTVDFPQTLTELNSFLGSFSARSAEIAATLKAEGYDLVLSDISPLGIAAGNRAGIPTCLFENFTWDWIYAPYTAEYPAFAPICSDYAKFYALADHHCQFLPASANASAVERVFPLVSRKPHSAAAVTRSQLGITPNEKMGLISMGGIPTDFSGAALTADIPAGVKLVLVGSFPAVERHDQLILLPHRSAFYHPDLVQAADFFIGKAGYSTLAEVMNAGKPFGYILRANFRESDTFSSYLRPFPNTLEISETAFNEFHLKEAIDRLTALQSTPSAAENGSTAAAEFILHCLKSGK